jgi:hypothetical protein
MLEVSWKKILIVQIKELLHKVETQMRLEKLSCTTHPKRRKFHLVKMEEVLDPMKLKKYLLLEQMSLILTKTIKFNK